MSDENLDTRFGVYAVIKKGSKFLMAKRADGSIGLIGGRVKQNETPLEAMRRELKEEVNLMPKNIVVTPITQKFKSNRIKGNEEHYFFFIELMADENPLRNEEEFIWVDEEEMVKSIFPDRERAKKEVLDLYKAGKLNS